MPDLRKRCKYGNDPWTLWDGFQTHASHQVQRRLTTDEDSDLIQSYVEGASIDSLARRYRVHRITIIQHLDRHGVTRRKVVRKMTDIQVEVAAERYATGRSLATVASELGVHPRTLGREFRRSGVPIRPRRGWTVQP